MEVEAEIVRLHFVIPSLALCPSKKCECLLFISSLFLYEII